jgi:molybdopterin/thiamine biosynthesis adenylyltransferase
VAEQLAVLPARIAAAILGSGGHHGTLDLRHDPAEDLLVISGYSKGTTRYHDSAGWLRNHYFNWGQIHHNTGLWFRVEPELCGLGYFAAVRGGAVAIEAFWDHVPSGRKVLPAQGSSFALTFSPHPEGRDPLWSGWWISREQARCCNVAVLDEDVDLLAPIADGWPIDTLADQRVVVIGAGSIGSAAAESLCAYGVRDLFIVDPDRLLPHNIARHRVDRSQVGRYKTTALAKRLQARDAGVKVEPLALDVIDDADRLRPVFAQASMALVTSDGVESRRVANHLAVRAGIPAVFACVLDNGRYGEILRVIPDKVGCLLCARAQLVEMGGLDPEPSLDRGYGTGTRHLPMVAVGGDLGVVGELAAKAVVSTLLERRGFRDQRLPGEHAIIGLRPAPGLAEPFDIEQAGEIRWRPGAPRRPACPSCGGR